MRCIAVMNQKGGCGKTTSVVSLAGCLAAEGHSVLVIDMDPPAHATLGLGIDPEEHYSDPFGQLRPISIGKPMTALYSG